MLLPEDKIDKSGECWLWLGVTNNDGYGIYKGQRVHRVVLAEKLGRPVVGLALHSCLNRNCCNPDHLREGTHLDNMLDMTAYGNHDGRNRRGEKHPLSKLSDDDRRLIRMSGEKGVVLAMIFDVSAATISMVRSGKRGKIDNVN